MKQYLDPFRSLQGGNVLFIILLAVALFAAITFAVTQASRTTPGSSLNETTDIKVSNILQFFSALDARVQRMVLSGVDPLQLAFTASVYKLGPVGAESTNCWMDNTSCSGTSCQVFAADGGVAPIVFDATYVVPGAGVNGRVTPGHLGKTQVAVANIGSSASDLVVYIPYVTPEICNRLNARMGITTNYTHAMTYPVGGEEGASIGANFGGCSTAAAWVSVPVMGDQLTAIAGKDTFCIPYDTISQGLAIRHVIHAR